MMGVSWPLWSRSANVPHFPAWSSLESLQPEWFLTPLCVAGLVISLCNRFGRFGSAIFTIAGLSLILFDQQRAQAWFYQTLVISAIYSLLPGKSAIGYVRFFAVVLYFHSALSKFDISFAQSMGPYLISPVLKLLPFQLSDNSVFWIVLAMPAGELLAATLLASGQFRPGAVAVLFMHLLLVALLGPWALDHSANVLIWNISMACQAIVLFWPDHSQETNVETPGGDHKQPSEMAVGLIQLAMMFVAFLPFFERAGLWDPWPSFALYSGHVEQLRIDFPVADQSAIPPELRAYIKGSSGNYSLDLTAWTRHTTGAPPYPAARLHRKLAQFIARGCPEDLPMTVTFLGKAHWRTGIRSQRVVAGRAEIARLK